MTPVHADEGNGAGSTHFGNSDAGLLEKPSELGVRHLARRHGELAVPLLAEPGHIAFYGHVIGWIRKADSCFLALHQQGVVVRRQSVAADEAMIAEAINVTQPRHGGSIC